MPGKPVSANATEQLNARLNQTATAFVKNSL